MPLLAKHGNVMEAPEVLAALKDQQTINQLPRKWTRLELIHCPQFRRVSLHVGNKGEIATHRIDYTLTNNGEIYKHYAPGL